MSESIPTAATTSNNGAALVPVPAAVPPNSAEAMRQVLGDASAAVFCTFDPKTPAGLRLMDKCAEAPDAKVKSLINLTFRVEHVYAHFVDLVNQENGEVVTCTRCCLIDTDGKVYACVSEGVKKSIQRLALQHGLPPWKGGIPVSVQLKDLANGRQWLTLMNAPEDEKKGGKK